MTKKRYRLLRRTMFENDVDQATLGKIIHRCPGYISVRFNGKMPFDANDMYGILDYFGVAHDQLHAFFPPHGFAEEN